MKWLRRSSMVGLALLLLVGVSCTSTDTTLTETQDATSGEQQPSQLLWTPGDLANAITSPYTGTQGGMTNLLVCSPQPYVVTTETIGPDGGEIQVGTHRLLIPPEALSENVTITAEQVTGKVNSVRFSPEGLKFQRSALLTMTYDNCPVVLLQKRIAFTNERLKILELLMSWDLAKLTTVSAPIDHFSRYAVAY